MGSLEGYATRGIRQQEHDCEPEEDFFDRCKRWWDTWIVQVLADKEPREEPYSILATSHGGFLGILVKDYLVTRGQVKLGKGVKIGRCDNASISLIELDKGGKWTLVKYSDIDHLDVVHTDTTADADVLEK
jgi:2,3-bisphosphoglycerate-dependent phosphoglycerate mutase